MDAFVAMDGVVASPQAYGAFFLFPFLMIIGAAIGCALARPLRLCAWTTSLAMMGVCGAWMGAEVAYLFGRVEIGGVHQFLAAVVGAGLFAYVWRRAHQPVAVDPDSGVALHEPPA
ncbi:hypothetical protein [Methylocystis parvus]|uniref:Uncharacterized protein n=1 Tax=Methylocystis parvus TaxID=134 RepID=A0A6B8M4D3_9HYPH|nr:hypothetical protein [Methylocystis parvus]QGM98784.1 hypothetical protein F7D14_15695 [Methylocystis parvus]WBK00866.1 hypothetical protein MMG94_03860 [Methylocystis parvus OBBP]